MIKGGHTSKDYDQSLSLLRAYADEPAVHIFLCSPLGAQITIKRSCKFHKPPFSEHALSIIQNLQILPRSMNTLEMSAAEHISIKAMEEASLIHKNESVIHIDQPVNLLQVAIWMLETATPSHTLSRLILPLCLVSGRRTTEILNGRSTYPPAHLLSTYTIGRRALILR